MDIDIRMAAAQYYDLNPNQPDDIPFYIDRLPSSGARILELGCGTGRVTIPLAAHAAVIHGLDLSEAMLALCRDKLRAAGLGEEKVVVEAADITDFDLHSSFDLIIAPFRVVQNLETDDQLAGLFSCIGAHLSHGGRCILNAFRPNRPREALLTTWVSESENLAWDVEYAGGRVTCHDIRQRVQADPLVLYPDLVYRHYIGREMVNEAVLSIPMRCFYPAEFLELIKSHGFTVLDKWGGYMNESYGTGSELVVEFTL